MTHVQITTQSGGGGTLVVDGQDISEHVLARGLKVNVSTDPLVPSEVHLVLKADVLEADLPDAVLDAIRDAEVPA